MVLFHDGNLDRNIEYAETYGLNFPILSDIDFEALPTVGIQRCKPLQPPSSLMDAVVHSTEQTWYPDLVDELREWRLALLLVEFGCRSNAIRKQLDADGDGYTADVDCDDANPLVHTSSCSRNGFDDDCDGLVDESDDVLLDSLDGFSLMSMEMATEQVMGSQSANQ